ncbi:hypothetical protein CGL27_07810 [Streptomyces sp. 11-1-2]|nr:hypothetical protein CGL27_07810 [Streptomyces sp. 11-1-2]
MSSVAKTSSRSPTTSTDERERTHRHQLIVTIARELAEAEDWEAVTTRRPAERVELTWWISGGRASVLAYRNEGHDE